MTVLETGFQARLPLRQVERHVDFQLHYDYVTRRRAYVERVTSRYARQLAITTANLGIPSELKLRQLQAALAKALEDTVRFGHRQARAEVAAHRVHPRAALYMPPAAPTGRPQSVRMALPNTIDEQAAALLRQIRRSLVRQRAVTPPPPGRARAALRNGLEGALSEVDRRARQATLDIAARVGEAARGGHLLGADGTLLEATAQRAATGSLHEAVLQLVGEALNLGRAAGASEEGVLYAMRSEQMDASTCDPCGALHGIVVRADSDEFYDLMPPNECDGEGRCRGIMVYSDSPAGFDE